MRTLYVIGNGFDLAHGLPTKYEDFHKWLQKNGYQQFIDMFEQLYNNVLDTKGKWCDIERALGEYDLNEVYEWDMNYQYCNTDLTSYQLCKNVKTVVVSLQNLLIEWAQSIQLANVKKIQNIYKIEKENSVFLSFNYTKTLERVYGIGESSILHIHGDVDNPNNIIIGYKGKHYQSRDDVPFTSMNEKEKAKLIIHNELRRYIKDTTYQIEKNHLFFDSLTDVKYVNVIGHSCADVDKPYFDRITDSIKEDALWSLYYHDINEKNYFEDFIEVLLKDKENMKKRLIQQ